MSLCLHPCFFSSLHHIYCASCEIIIIFKIVLTLSSLSLRDPLSDYPTGIIHSCGGLKLHRLHNVALANADFQRQHHHLGRRCVGGLQLHLHTTRTEREGNRTEQERMSLLQEVQNLSTVIKLIDCDE